MEDLPPQGFVADPLGLGLIAAGFGLALLFSREAEICSSRAAPGLLVAATVSFLVGFALCLPKRARRVTLVLVGVLAVPAVGAALALMLAADGWC
jgi:hypothetical protein